MKKLLSRFPCCTTAAVGGADEYSDSSTAGDASSPSATPSSTTSTLQSTLSLQTLPSVPSLQSFSLLDTTTITLSLSHSSSFSLSSSITCIALHGSSLYATSGHQISVYDHSTLAHLDTFNSDGASAGAVKSVAFADGKVLTAHQDGRIRVWKQHMQKHVQNSHNHNHNHNHKLVSTLPTVKDRLLRFPFPSSHVQVRRHKRRMWVEHHDAVSGLTVSTNNSTNNNINGNVYSISWDKTLKVWAPKKGFKCLESVTAHDDAINAVTVNSDGTVYTGSADGRIGVWGELGSDNNNKKRHARVATLEKHKSAVNALALSTDGSILFSGACDRSILVWEREDSAKYMVVSGALRGHDGAILCLINVADFLISGSADRTVRIWRRGVEGKYCCLKVLVGHLKPVKSLAAKMEEEVDELTVFSGGLDGEIKVWKIKVNYNL